MLTNVTLVCALAAFLPCCTQSHVPMSWAWTIQWLKTCWTSRWRVWYAFHQIMPSMCSNGISALNALHSVSLFWQRFSSTSGPSAKHKSYTLAIHICPSICFGGIRPDTPWFTKLRTTFQAESQIQASHSFEIRTVRTTSTVFAMYRWT